MRWLAKLRMLLRSIFERRQLDTELDEELREHMERETEDNLRAGMSAEQARSAARRTVGALSQIKDECRDARAAGFIQIFARDLQYSLRILWRSPLVTLIALITLSLGIGATSAIFSVVNGVLLKPLPYPHASTFPKPAPPHFFISPIAIGRTRFRTSVSIAGRVAP